MVEDTIERFEWMETDGWMNGWLTKGTFEYTKDWKMEEGMYERTIERVNDWMHE